MAILRQLDEHGIHAAWVILDAAAPVGPDQQRRQRAVKIEHVEQPDAVAADDPLLKRQEVQNDAGRLGWQPALLRRSERVIQGGGRGLSSAECTSLW